jgi:two-component system OmpR family response regulator
MPVRVLLLEDENDAAQHVRVALAGWNDSELVHVTNAADARRRLQAGGFDLVILDRSLDRTGIEPDGLEIAKALRAAGNQTPVLVLSSLATTQERILGRDAGADDYLTKPFDSAELVSVVNALLRRAAMQQPIEALVLGRLDIRLMARTVHWNGTYIALSDQEFDILRFLAENCDVVQSRERLWRAVWTDRVNLPPATNVIDVALTRLRAKLSDATGGRSLVETVRRQGYILRSPLNG